MARRLLINELELDALDGLPHLAVVLYIKAIRPYMDYATGITGIKRGISYQSMAEQLYIEPEQGRHNAGSPTKSAIRNAIKSLTKSGLLKAIEHPKRLIFRCLLAATDKSVLNNNDTSATHNNDTSTAQALAALTKELEQLKQSMSDTPKAAISDTPPVSGGTSYINTTSTDFKTVEQNEPQASGGGGDMKLIFPKGLGVKEREAIEQGLKQLPPDDMGTVAQQLVDELAGVMKIKALESPVSYFSGIVRRFYSGEFIPTAGPAIAEARERAKQEAEEARKRHAELTRPKEERNNSEATAAGRQAMRAALKQKRTEEEET